MKKLLGIVIALCLVMGTFASALAEGVPADQIKIGYICIGDDNEAFTANHSDAVRRVQQTLGISDAQVIFKWNIPETEACLDAAIDLAEQGCDIIFGNSFSYEEYLLEAAEQYPEIEFCHATGVMAAASGLDNFHNFFSNIDQARFVSGVAAGLKLNQMIEEGKLTAEAAKLGYVGAKPFAEVISGMTAFFLGARYICPTVTMSVIYTNEWSDMALEKEAAEALIADGCVLLSQHSDTTGPSSTCEEKGIPFVGYNVSMISTAPNQAIISCAINWEPYITYAIENVINGTKFEADWCKGFEADAVILTALNDTAAAPGTADKLDEVVKLLSNGELHVFDCSTFTVKGETLTSFNSAYGFEGNELIWDGYFHESELRSAPCFEIIIDGITTNLE